MIKWRGCKQLKLKMKKIVLLPLDERPCNYAFPYQLFDGKDMQIVHPPRLGDKKQPANPEEILAFLEKECRDADGLVLSLDTLLYGGLIPSRLHHCEQAEIQKRLEAIRTLKRDNPSLTIYAFQVIMRCPRYSSSDEEPDYYGICGEQIHTIGRIRHQARLGMCDEAALAPLYEAVLPEYLEDYTDRRAFNLDFNLLTLEYVREGLIDFLVIPQDDSAEYGFTAMDQEIIREKITSDLLQAQVLMYPGADEIAMTLLSRFSNVLAGKKPAVFVRYAAQSAPLMVPSYEDRPLGETMKYQLLAAGCRMVSSQAEADFVLAVNAPAFGMTEAAYQPNTKREYTIERNLTDFVFFIQDCTQQKKPVVIGDIAYANGADLELIALLNKLELLDKINGYAGWNTSSNTLGTSIAQGVHFLYSGMDSAQLDFLAERYVEDAGYCSVVRKYVTQNHLPALDMDYFDVREQSGEVSRIVWEQLRKFIQTQLSSTAEKITLKSVSMPWRRMFEVGLEVHWNHS